MTELGKNIPGGLSKRQLFGLEYTVYSKHLPLVTKAERHGILYSYSLKGKAKQSPEIDMLDLDRRGTKAVVIYHDLDQFIIHAQNGNQLDLVSITPKGWVQKVIQLTSPEFKAPEVHEAFNKYLNIDVPGKECVISEGFGFDNKKASDVAVVSALWNTLIARFTEEIGDPMNDQSFAAMRQSVLQRRQEVLDALHGKTGEHPRLVALRSFSQKPA